MLLDLYVGMQTRRIRVGQLGIVLPADNPIRVAEDIAMLDHMTGGRANAGFARGYQRRWVDIMAQQMHGIHGALPHQHDAVDAANRAAFEECFQIIKRAWTEELLTYDGRYWRVPAGATPWEMDYTDRFGAGVVDGVVRAVGVVPKPLQKPHPPLFQPFASSERSIRWCAQEGRHRDSAAAPPGARGAPVPRSTPRSSGRPLGDGVGVLRDVIVADTDDEAMALWADSGAYCGAAWFEPFGFAQGMVDPATGARADLFGDGLALVGSVDTVTRQLERLLARLPARWLFAWTYNGLIPHAKLMRSIERFATDVLPRVGRG